MNADKFLDLYRELEINVRSQYNLDNSESVSYFLSHNSEYVRFQNEIRYMSDIRNLISHNPRINGTYAIDISDETIKFLSKLIDEIKNRKKLKDIMMPISKVYFAYENTKVIDVINNLSDKLYNHVPVKDGNKITGVFDEMSLFNLLKDGVQLNNDLTFKDIDQYTKISKESRIAYLHANEDDYEDNLKNIFSEMYSRGKRIGLVFVENRSNELVGIISTTDILGK